MKLLKTREKTIVTLDIGPFRAKETIRWCPQHRQVFASPDLKALTPAHGTFGFDVLIYVGNALFLRSRSNQEIREELRERNIVISDREISYLGKKFVFYVTVAHQESRPAVKELLEAQGGYILHVDGTCESDSPHVFTGMDGLSNIVLDSAKYPSEKSGSIAPFFQRIEQDYGRPAALVHDMGKGILKAVEEVFPDVPDFICHFHFLRALGGDLLKKDYDGIRDGLRRLRIRTTLRSYGKTFEPLFRQNQSRFQEILTGLDSGHSPQTLLAQTPAAFAYALIHWALHPVNQFGGYGFPFDLTHVVFLRRLHTMETAVSEMLVTSFQGDLDTNWPFFRLLKALRKVTNDEKLLIHLVEIEEKIEVFEALRSALRVALPEGKQGLNDDGDETPIHTIKENVEAFRDWVTTDKRFLWNKADKKMVAQLDQYWEKLFADPIPVTTPQGIVMIQPQRTNNILERFFRDLKRRNRKKSGISSMGKTLTYMLPSTPLVCNLEHTEYEQIIRNGCESLEERFSQIDCRLIWDQFKQSRKSSVVISPQIKKIIAQPNFPEQLSNHYAAFASN